MEQKRFNIYSRIVAFIVFLIASVTYLSTIEPTASFWDCGEFIASSYKLEVGHAPGNPVFQLIARFFTLFTDAEHAAVAVNAMSALCSSLTILFLFLTIAHLSRKLIEKNGGNHLTIPNVIAILGSASVGALAYCWSDTFWFSAVEGEVYAMSSLITAAVFWAILKWEDEADEDYSNRWIVLIGFLMGLSIGVHLLNLLAIPAIAFVYYYKKSTKFSFWRGFGVLALSGIILAFILWGIIPFIPKIAAVFDLLFVNVFNLPFNSGAVFFMFLLLALCFFAIYFTYKKKKVLLNTIFLCFTMIIIGYSTFAVVVIRSSANTPTNEYQPDNPYTLVRYLGREQYGSAPLLYGETYASVPTSYKTKPFYTPLHGKYIKAEGAIEYIYPSESKMLFPRMYAKDGDGQYVRFYQRYSTGKGKTVRGGTYKMPTASENLAYFFDYQVSWMYVRYFMWNFAGRQNDIHSPSPGDITKGNWESGIGFYDQWRLGDQSEGPEYFTHNKAKNHYYMLPFLLGLIGFFFQLRKDKQNWWVTTLLFLLTGLAIIVYLNQPPYQVRERDYAYAGSFYMFAVWIGMAVLAIFQDISDGLKKIRIPEWATAACISVVFMLVPILMACENWDDHDRSNRYTARDMAYNYFASTDPNAILITHGDNDTFPLWYVQEVESVRPDVRVMNTSLLGTDWYIDQMQNQQYDSAPIKFTTKKESYLYGVNEWIPIVDRVTRPITVKEGIELFNNPKVKIRQYGDELSDYMASHTLLLPVNIENVKKYGIVSPDDYDKIVDTIVLQIPEGKTMLTKPELMILDMFANYDWDRPIYFVSQGGDLQIGLRDYLQFEGFTSKFVPIKSTNSTTEIGQIDATEMYDRVKNQFRWDSFNKKFYADYQNISTFNGVLNLRNIFVQTAIGLLDDKQPEKATEILDLMQQYIIPENFPLNSSIIFSGYSLNEYIMIQAIDLYFRCGQKEKAIGLAKAFLEETLQCIQVSSHPYGNGIVSKSNLENNYQLYYYTLDVLNKRGAKEEATELEKVLDDTISALAGITESEQE